MSQPRTDGIAARGALREHEIWERSVQIFGTCPPAPRPLAPPPRPPRPLRPAALFRRDVLRRRPEPPANCTDDCESARDRVFRGPPLSVLEESCIVRQAACTDNVRRR